ncbi:MAG: rhodanese-like domain-containing protein [Phycisphaerae bacterium]|nr:rhodanese-like domain-containing protein [Phycisphaerae bacterium]
MSCCSGVGIGPVAGKAVLLVVLAGAIGLVDSRIRPIASLQPAQPKSIEDLLAQPPAKPAGDSKPAPTPTPTPAPAPTPSQPAAPQPAPPAQVKPAEKNDLLLTIDQGRQLFDRLQSTGDVVFVDARNPPEFAAGRIATAINLSPDRFFGVLPPELDAISREFIVVVYCGGGDCDASKLVAKRFNEQGYMKVYVLEAGYPAWVQAGLPIEK